MLELTNFLTGLPLFINLAAVEAFVQEKDHCLIMLTGNRELKVEEAASEIISSMEQFYLPESDPDKFH